MFTFPYAKWVGGIFYEHGHRLVASFVGFLTVILASWTWLSESRRWIRTLSLVALLSVITQGILGGLTVKYLLPTSISMTHACLAQTFFCMTIALAYFTSPTWKRGLPRVRGQHHRHRFTQTLHANNWRDLSAVAAGRVDAPHAVGPRDPGFSARFRQADSRSSRTTTSPFTSPTGLAPFWSSRMILWTFTRMYRKHRAGHVAVSPGRWCCCFLCALN